jgi:hypothetical protein
MDIWKLLSLAIRCLALANLAAIASVLYTDASRQTALKVMWAFRASVIVLLLLLPVDYLVRRSRKANLNGIIFNAALTLLLLLVWFAISAATF